MDNLAVSFARSISEIGADTWNGLSGTANPFTRYEFLHALETSGCTTRASGWQVQHLVVRRVKPGLDEVVAVMPLYLKTNSWGEYVFDWAWANAYENHGLDYYPKFVTSIPFTPSQGPRLLLRDGEQADRIVPLICQAIEEQADFLQASSWHVLFPEPAQKDWFEQAGLFTRVACQFHWFNQGYDSFEDFLASLNSRKRKNLKKERARVAEAGIRFRRLTGAEISTELWQDFYGFYQSTYLMRGMRGYLSLEFFTTVAATMPEQLTLVVAEQEDRVIAAALFFESDDTLYGRYWGSARDYQFLHFETCYYQGQEYAIHRGLARFDSGAQGEHKIQRGFEPIITYSSHWIARPDFGDAIGRFVKEEAPHILAYRDEARRLLPYRRQE